MPVFPHPSNKFENQRHLWTRLEICVPFCCRLFPDNRVFVGARALQLGLQFYNPNIPSDWKHLKPDNGNRTPTFLLWARMFQMSHKSLANLPPCWVCMEWVRFFHQGTYSQEIVSARSTNCSPNQANLWNVSHPNEGLSQINQFQSRVIFHEDKPLCITKQTP